MKVYFHTFGCKVNQVESENLKCEFASEGIDVVKDINSADVVVVNSCAVTDSAEKKYSQFVKKIKRDGSSKKIVVTGCLAELHKEATGYADLVIGNGGKHKLLDYLKEYKNYSIGIEEEKLYQNFKFNNKYDKTRGYLKIQDGCDEFCSYCIIPYLRGKPRSKSMADIIKEAQDMIEKGCKEIVLVGIHVGKYGLDNNESLIDVLKNLILFDGEYRIRLSSIEVGEITDELIDLIVESNGKICPHIHIPIQSGSNKILKLMKRKYSVEDFVNKVLYLKKIIPDITIGTDIITGFPSENEEDFNESLETIIRAKIDYMHVFPYSEREGTEAKVMKGKVAENVKRERAKKLRDIGESLLFNSAKKLFGRSVRVLSEKDNKGITDNYFDIQIVDKVESNQFVDVKIIGVSYDGSLMGKREGGF